MVHLFSDGFPFVSATAPRCCGEGADWAAAGAAMLQVHLTAAPAALRGAAGAAPVRYCGLFVIKTGLKTVQFNFCLGFSCCPVLKAVRWTLWCLTAAVKVIFLDWKT